MIKVRLSLWLIIGWGLVASLIPVTAAAQGPTVSHELAGSCCASTGANGIAGLALDPAGRLWAATASEGVSVLDGPGWTTYTTDAGLADNFVQSVAIDGQGHPWFGT